MFTWKHNLLGWFTLYKLCNLKDENDIGESCISVSCIIFGIILHEFKVPLDKSGHVMKYSVQRNHVLWTATLCHLHVTKTQLYTKLVPKLIKLHYSERQCELDIKINDIVCRVKFRGSACFPENDIVIELISQGKPI